MTERQTLLKELQTYRKDISEFEGKSIDAIRSALAAEEADLQVYMNDRKPYKQKVEKLKKKELVNQCIDAGIIDSEVMANDWSVQWLQSKLVESMLKADRLKDKTSYSFDMGIDETKTVSESLYDLQTLKKTRFTDNPSDEQRRLDNIRILNENLIRERLGLKPIPLQIFDTDLEALIQLDDFEYGDSCKEYISNIQDKFEKEKIKNRLGEMITMRKLNRQREQREQDYISNISLEYNKLKDSQPVKLITQNGRVFEINPLFNQWVDNLQRFNAQLRNKERFYNSLEQKFEDEKTDKRASFFQILRKTKDLLENL